jgi:lysophospholipase L1-like esterase
MIVDALRTNGMAPAEIMCVGDSITVGSDGGAARWVERSGYRLHLWRLLRLDGYAVSMVGPYTNGGAYPGWDRNHAGVGGETTANILTRIDAQMSTYAPDLVILLAGTNDLKGGSSAANTLDRIDQLLTAIGPTPCVLSTIPLLTSYQTKTNTFNAGLPSEADKHSHATFVDGAAGVSAANDLIDDGVHPNGPGYLQLADQLLSTVEGLL